MLQNALNIILLMAIFNFQFDEKKQKINVSITSVYNISILFVIFEHGIAPDLNKFCTDNTIIRNT